MNKKFVSVLVSLVCLTSLTGCGDTSVKELGISVISPKGAPAISLARYQKDYGAKLTVTAPTSVVAAFSSNENDVIIFDVTKGTTFISKQSKAYKLAKVITSGNSYVISTGHDSNSSYDATDKAVSFGSGSFFTKVFSLTSGLSADNISEVSDVSQALTVALTGKNNGEDVDYVILSEPFVTKALAQNSTLSVKENLNDAWKTYSKAQGYNSNNGYDTFPMAGVFISDTAEADDTKKTAIENFLNEMDYVSKDLRNNQGKDILATIKTDSDSELYNLTDTYGMDYATLASVLSPSTNGSKATNPLGFIGDENFDYKAFASEALQTSLADSVFSSYYGK